MITYYIAQWLSPIVHILGLVIAIWAFRKSQKKGYIVIAVYYALAVFSLLAMPRINRALAKQNTPSISNEKQEQMDEEIAEIYQRYYEEEGLEPKPMTLNLNLPFGPIVLVSGLFVLARKEKRSKPEH